MVVVVVVVVAVVVVGGGGYDKLLIVLLISYVTQQFQSVCVCADNRYEKSHYPFSKVVSFKQ